MNSIKMSNHVIFSMTALYSIIEDNSAGKADESKAKEKTEKGGAGTRKKRAAEETEKGKTEPPTSTTQFDQSTMLAPSASPNEGTDDVSISFNYCKFGYFREFYFRETLHMRSFVKIESWRNGEITLSFTDIRTSCPSCEFLMLQICLLALFPKIKFRKNFQIYSI